MRFVRRERGRHGETFALNVMLKLLPQELVPLFEDGLWIDYLTHTMADRNIKGADRDQRIESKRYRFFDATCGFIVYLGPT